MMRLLAVSFVSLFAVVVAASAPPDDSDERVLRVAGIASDGPALLQFFRDRIAGGGERDRIVALIKKLGDDSFDEREKASAQLVAAGAKAEEQLREAVKNPPDAEVKTRAEICLKEIAKGGSARLPAAAARLLGRRKPDGAVAVLLAYLPSADGDTAREAVGDALATLALHAGKPDPVLVAALGDKSALKRAVAATALARAGARDQLPALRKLLRDPDAVVRLRVALALVNLRDKEAVPALIDLLADLPPNQGAEAEDVLRILAGEAAPDTSLGQSETSRRTAREAWSAWWKKNGDKIDLAKLALGPRELGYTLVVQLDMPAAGAAVRAAGRVVEYGRDGKIRWQIEGLTGPRDAQMLPNGNVFIFEYTACRVTERTTKGDIVWEKTVSTRATLLLSAQRLANGNTFIVNRTGWIEIDKNGKEVASQTLRTTIAAARKLRTGEIVYITGPGQCVRLDKDGKEVASFNVGRMPVRGGIDLLPNGNLLVPLMMQNKVLEFDAKGNEVWSATVVRPTSVTRLANGHVLVSSLMGRCVVELDKNGKQVWKQTVEGQPYKASRR